MKQQLEKIYYSFAIQLVVLHLKRNLVLVGLWLLLLVVITGNMGRVFGVPYLFLDPEYLNRVGFWSFFIVGIAFGGLVTSFHITCYILYGQKFTFCGILEKPFIKFSINNSIIPLMVFLVYLVEIIRFQFRNEFTDVSDLLLMVLGLILGLVAMLVLLYSYFKATNKDIFKFLAGSVDRRLRKVKLTRLNVLNKIKETKEYRYRVDSYLNDRLRVQSTDGLHTFYDKESILKVFDQNHFNSVVIELFAIGALLVLGVFMDRPFFKIPAAASAMLIITVLMMITGAISYWFRSWGAAVSIALFLLLNMMVKTGLLEGRSEATGMNYRTPPAAYNLQSLDNSISEENLSTDYRQTIQTLEHWKAKNDTVQKPKAVFLCVSGGGQRAALWAMQAMQQMDSALSGKLMDQTVLITGASGGIVGAAFYRELFLQSLKDTSVDHNALSFRQDIAKDILNPIIFSLLVNDLFIRAQFFEYEERRYQKDRGFAFEQQLNINTTGFLSKPLISYRLPEVQAKIPMMILSPTIANDGRKLYISPQSVSYMNIGRNQLGDNYKVTGVDFMRFFWEQDAANLRFLSALRMSASFPYITPNVILPSTPALQIMDAGIADNFGLSDAIRFIYTFKDWLEENTSGVVLVSVRDTRKNNPVEAKARQSIIQKFSSPISSVYNNLGNLQDINNDTNIAYAREWFGAPIDLVSIEYNTYINLPNPENVTEQQQLENKELERASLSWHLTTREKQNIMQNIFRPSNQAAIDQLRQIVNTPEK